MPGSADPGSMLLMTALMVVLYLAVVRLIDMNEKEPLWAMASFFLVGAAASVALVQAVGTPVLDLDPLRGAIFKEAARFAAVGAGVGGLLFYGRKKGIDEFNGLMDGIVYGATVGLGFHTAREVMNQMLIGGFALPGQQAGALAGFHKVFLTGLAEGIFGAILGAGIGAAVESRGPVGKILWPAGGLVVAFFANWGYVTLAKGNALGGDQGLVRAYVALALPVVIVVAAAVYALSSERKAIRDQLSSEQAAGVVTASDLALLQSVVSREAAYLKVLLAGNLRTWLAMKALHNRQVQLAFVKARATGEADAKRRERLDQEIANLRAVVLEKQKAVQAGGTRREENAS